MARKTRKPSSFGIYHCVLKCLKDFAYFVSEKDKNKLLECFRNALDLQNTRELYCLAYCIMDNHIHFVFEGELTSVESFFKSVGASFAHYLRIETSSDGKFVKDRYYSEPIEGENQFVNTLAYVLNNPTHLSDVGSAGEYEYSSYQYLKINDNDGDGITCNERRREHISDDDLIEIIKHKGEEIKKLDLEFNAKHYKLDDEVYAELREMMGRKQAKMIYKLNWKKQQRIFLKLLNFGSSMRSISRVTAVSYGEVRRVLALET